MSFFAPQNPGIGGLNELTQSEEIFLTSFAGLPYEDGDTLFIQGGLVQRLPIGTSGKILTVSGGFPVWAASGGGLADSFETVSKNLDATDATLNYTGENLTSIAYVGGITKTLNYTGENLTSVVLSGSTPAGIDLTKTLSYTGENLTGVSYS